LILQERKLKKIILAAKLKMTYIAASKSLLTLIYLDIQGGDWGLEICF